MKKDQKRVIILAMLVMTSVGVWAQIPNGYYNSANNKTGDELKTALHDIIKGHTSIFYSQLWNAFWSTDNKGNGVVWDMYSDIPDGTPPYTFSMGQNQCGTYVAEGDCYNREHSWPQSWFSGDDQATPSRDLHHVFPTDGFVNSQRSNNPYGEVNTATWTSQNGSKLGTCKPSLGYNGTVFEPIDEYKGDFARALMYMSVRYYTEDDDWGTSGMTNKSEILPWAMAMLLRWSDDDPVSQKEIDRNNVIYSDYQHNRNPFIDHPEYARMIWDPDWNGGDNIGNGDYVKVTSSDEITDGDYLIVCENNNVAFNGGLSTLDAVGNTISVFITDGVISSSDETDGAFFTITAKTGGGYSIKSASGYYIGNTSNENALKSSQSDIYTNMLSISEENVDIICSSSYLRFNSASNQTRFRYFKSGTYTSQQAIQLYKRAAAYSITLATVEHGNISANSEEAVEGTTITLTATPDPGYELDHWTVTDALGSQITVVENQFEMPASNVMVSATFVYVGQPFEQKYYLVTSTNQLVAGRTYLIVNTSAEKALGTTQNTNNRSAADVIISDNMISNIGNNVCELTLGGQSGAWTFFDANWGDNGGYLYAASSSSNNLKTQATNNANGQWSISIASNGIATIVAQGDNTKNQLRYNPNHDNPIFSCYGSNSNLAKVELYIRSEEYDITENTTIPNLFSFDKHTVRSGATLTVSGTATCDDASQLIIEDGGQLVHHSEGVQATFKRYINAYTNDGGWYTIALPFASFNSIGELTTADYDLYAYHEDANLEWYNYKAHESNFIMAPGQGYLYAHNPTTTLRMMGILNSGDYGETVDLSYASSNASIKGFNLLGNPTMHDITFTKTSSVSDGYYYIENGNAWTYTTSNIVPAGRGFLVKANDANQSVTLNPQSKGTRGDVGQYLSLSIGDEKVHVKLNEGVSMPLIDLDGHHAALYLLSEHRQYAMLVRGEAASLDLIYEPRCNESKTLVVDAKGLGLDYLHLIDQMTGADIDLLQTPEYTFTAKVTDYKSRFRLLFAAIDGPLTGSGTDTFAFFNGSEWVISDAYSDATVQVVDMMGRVVISKDVACNISISGMTPGVYVLRLITESGVKVQKIVLE